MHCASVGEFEQGRPVLEALKKARPDVPILLTFFSPSGYEARKGFALATHVDYLPPDSASNAIRLQRLLRPTAAIFVKYEFWQAHLHALKHAQVPTYLVSAIFRPSQPFFKWYGAGHRAMLGCFTHLFVQDEASRILLGSINVQNVSVSGDTRFDRVNQVVSADEPISVAQAFRARSNELMLVAGSTWPKDEEVLQQALSGVSMRAMIVPHELGAAHLERLAGALKNHATWSELVKHFATVALDKDAGAFAARYLVVDQMGYLSRLYQYADITYVGGGFGSGIHNTLEAAAWGKPVIFGPNHARFAEAQGLIAVGAGYTIANAEELRAVLQRLTTDSGALERASEAARSYVAARTGATQRVVAEILPRITR